MASNRVPIESSWMIILVKVCWHILESVMNTDKPTPQPLSGSAVRFVGGVAMGTLIVPVPFSAGYASQPSIVQLAVAAFVVLLAGVMSSLWGERFLEAISKAIDSTSV